MGIRLKERGTPTAKSWLFAYRSAGQLPQRSKILMLIVVPYLSPYLICIPMPRDWFPTQNRKKKQKGKVYLYNTRNDDDENPIGSFKLDRCAHSSFD